MHNKLICFDVDRTLIKGHSHNYLASNNIRFYPSELNQLIVNGKLEFGPSNKEYNSESVKEKMQEFLDNSNFGVRDSKVLLPILTNLLKLDYKIAITSFSLFPDSIPLILERIGLNSTDIADINIICGFPPKGPGDPVRKMDHIRKAMKLTGVEKLEDVILIDDDIQNIEAAQMQEVTGILIKKDSDFQKIYQVIPKLRELSDEIGHDVNTNFSEEQDNETTPLLSHNASEYSFFNNLLGCCCCFGYEEESIT